jgi:radical SAM protein with 4Fe4S-binding SPASM domain
MRQHPVIAAPPAQLTLTADEFRPSGRGAGTSHQLRPGAGQHRHPYDWPTVHGEEVLADDSFFRLAPRGGPLPGLNLCGAGRVVCLIDPVGDVYACPFAIHEELLAAGVRQAGGFEKVWTDAGLFAELRRPQSGGACSACGFFAPAGAAAWRPSSSPGRRWTDPIPNACRATLRLSRWRIRPPRPAIVTPTAALHEHGPRWDASPAGSGGRLRSR